jgi:glycosyltransferase involved in cell wall biosynthesis
MVNANSNPRVTIVIPSYNAEKFLEATVKSVLAQSFQAWEVVIVNDGSRDGTAGIIAHYEGLDPRIKSVFQDNCGLACARNSGMAFSNPQTEYFAFLDADDTWESSALETLVTRLDQHPESVCAYGLARFMNMTGEGILPGESESVGRRRPTYRQGRVDKLPLDKPTTFNTLIVANCIHTPGCTVVRRSAITSVGEFDPKLPGCEDWDMHIRLSRLGDFQFINKVVTNYRRHDGSLSADLKRLRQCEDVIRNRAAAWPTNTPEQRRIATTCYRPTQLYFVREKMKLATECARRLDAKGVLYQAKPIAGGLSRALRGHP